MQQYIYGASVQGIQPFIFQTNKLKEIVGASQLVDNICTTEFKKFCKEKFGHEVIDDNIIMSAAGNIKYLVDETTCQKIVHSFPKHISNYAPGITISQAVVKQSNDLKDDIDDLEKRLKAQRNQPTMPIDIGYMGLERARRTGGVAISNKNGFIDRATFEKIETPEEDTLFLFKKCSGDDTIRAKDVPFDVSEITKQSDNAWLAIVHADGNGLGLLLSNLSNEITESQKTKEAFIRFSKELDAATQEAVQVAYNEVVHPIWEQENNDSKKHLRKPIRPVLLGGDDLTVIIRADLAFNFTKVYLKAFEDKTKEHFKFMADEFKVKGFENGLTACAGIAYIKESYPFHYGVHLAESLTSETKTKLKNINNGNAPSALNFYKVQSSFIEDLKSMKARTHFAEAAKIDFDYGPYLISQELDGIAQINELEEPLKVLLKKENRDTNPVAKLRQWSAELHKDENKADFMLKRIKQVNGNIYKELELDKIIKDSKSKVNDLIALSSF